MTQTPNPYPEKSARWWFWQYLPEPYKSQAIDNYDEKYLSANGELNLLPDDLSISLDSSFDWFKTPKDQGYGYWMNLWQRARDGEFSTPNTNAS